jgi:hypothetical protein
LYEPSKAIRRGTMIGLVSMIGSWGSPEKAAIEALVVGTIAPWRPIFGYGYCR